MNRHSPTPWTVRETIDGLELIAADGALVCERRCDRLPHGMLAEITACSRTDFASLAALANGTGLQAFTEPASADELFQAAAVLARSARGRATALFLFALLETAGSAGFGHEEQTAAACLIAAGWGRFHGTARQVLRAVSSTEPIIAAGGVGR